MTILQRWDDAVCFYGTKVLANQITLFFIYFLQLIRLLDSLFRTACPSFSFIQFIYFFWCSKNAPGTKSTTMNLPHKAWTTLITEAIDWHDRSIKFALKEIGYLVVIAIRWFLQFGSITTQAPFVVVIRQLYYIIYIKYNSSCCSNYFASSIGFVRCRRVYLDDH